MNNNPDVRVRVAQADEQKLWESLGRECCRDVPEFLPENLYFPPVHIMTPAPDVVWLVAEKDGQPAGRALIVKTANSRARLLDLCVKPELRRQGIGTALLREAESVVCGWRVPSFSFAYPVDESALALRSLMKKQGFAEGESYSLMVDLTRTVPDWIREKLKAVQVNGVRLRRLTTAAADVAMLCEMHERFFPGYPAGMLPAAWTLRRVISLHMAHDTQVALAAEKDGRPLGFVMGNHDCAYTNGRYVRRARESLLGSIAVVEEARRLGIATALCFGLMDALREYGNTAMCYAGAGKGSGAWKLAHDTLGGAVLRQYNCSKDWKY